MMSTLERDNTAGQDEALLDIYRKLRPGELPTKESAQTLLENLFFKEKRYDLARVGRYKLDKKLGLHTAKVAGPRVLTGEDIITIIEYLLRLHAGDKMMTAPGGVEVSVEIDDIDHIGNRRVRTVGPLGFVEIPYRRVIDGKVTDEVDYLVHGDDSVPSGWCPCNEAKWPGPNRGVRAGPA